MRVYICREAKVIMKSIKTLFEYQKFEPNSELQTKIDAITHKYLQDKRLQDGVELRDEDLDLAAAGEIERIILFPEKYDADKK